MPSIKTLGTWQTRSSALANPSLGTRWWTIWKSAGGVGLSSGQSLFGDKVVDRMEANPSLGIRWWTIWKSAGGVGLSSGQSLFGDKVVDRIEACWWGWAQLWPIPLWGQGGGPYRSLLVGLGSALANPSLGTRWWTIWKSAGGVGLSSGQSLFGDKVVDRIEACWWGWAQLWPIPLWGQGGGPYGSQSLFGDKVVDRMEACWWGWAQLWPIPLWGQGGGPYGSQSLFGDKVVDRMEACWWGWAQLWPIPLWGQGGGPYGSLLVRLQCILPCGWVCLGEIERAGVFLHLGHIKHHLA